MNNIQNNIDKRIQEITSKPFSNKKRKNKTCKIMILSKPNINHIKLTKEDIKKIKEKALGNELIKFRKKLYKYFQRENLKLLNNNINSLKIKIRYLNPKIFSKKIATGEYKLDKNKVYLLNSFKETAINHEFLHMATSFYDKKLKIGFCGFQQILYLKKQVIGYGLNEGYTELLTDRYFKNQIKYKSFSYDRCNFFASKLEEIIGQKQMESFYMNADLHGLYKYLLNFDNATNIMTFIIMLDHLLKNTSSDKCNKHHELIQCYLAKWYICKKKQELNNNIINEDTFNNQVKNYINSLGNRSLCLKNYVKQKEYCK